MSEPSGLRPGDVISLFDGTVSPPKTKRFICLVVAEGWLFRINSRSHFKPHFPIQAAANPGCLDHDSFVEMRGIVDWDVDALLAARRLGRLSATTAKALVDAVIAARTLTASQAGIIVAALRQTYGFPDSS